MCVCVCSGGREGGECVCVGEGKRVCECLSHPLSLFPVFPLRSRSVPVPVPAGPPLENPAAARVFGRSALPVPAVPVRFDAPTRISGRSRVVPMPIAGEETAQGRALPSLVRAVGPLQRAKMVPPRRRPRHRAQCGPMARCTPNVKAPGRCRARVMRAGLPPGQATRSLSGSTSPPLRSLSR